ncbi:MAG TPA: 50S ribosomal protein L21 [Terriglobia bacterium]|nr:50S ribosomal protein L21 [Terriglobia bacterium]
MYAIFRTGGKEYKVKPGDVVRVEKLPAEPGAGVEFNHVFAVRKQTLVLGSPLVADAKVTGTVLRNGRGRKVRVFKFKASKQYRRSLGHRQDFSEVLIREIVGA